MGNNAASLSKLGNEAARQKCVSKMLKIPKVEFDDQLLRHIANCQNDEAKSMVNQDLVNAHDGWGTLLHHAAKCGNETMILHLLDMGSVIDCLGRYRRTALEVAVENRQMACAKVLLEAKANIDIVNSDGQSVFQAAVASRKLDSETLRVFFDRARSAASSNVEFFESLVKAGCSLRHATFSNDIEVVKYFLNRSDVQINFKNHEGKAALHIATELNNVYLVKILIDAGANLNILEDSSMSPLFIAAKNGNIEIVRLLLERGADPSIEDEDNCTPLLVLFTNLEDKNDEEIYECAKLLLQYGARPRSSRIDFLTFFNNILTAMKNCERTLDNRFIAYLTMLKMFNVSNAKRIQHRITEDNLESFARCVLYHVLCKQTLEIKMFREKTLKQLLIETSDDEMKTIVRNETYVTEIEDVCFDHKLSGLCPYYYETLMRRMSKARCRLNLERKTLFVLSRIFKTNYGQIFFIARQITEYVSDNDVKYLCEV